MVTSEVSERFGGRLLDTLGPDTLTHALQQLSAVAEVAEGPVIEDRGFRVVVSIKGGPGRWEIRCELDSDGRIVALTEGKAASSDLSIVVTHDISTEMGSEVHGLFDLAYGDANHDYLDDSIASLGTLALGYRANELVGFAVGGHVIADLPQPTLVLLAGLCCVDPDHRRQGIAGRLENLSISAAGVPRPAPHVVTAGRMAHPGSYRQIAIQPRSVPRPGVRPSPFQQEVGRKVAKLFGAFDFDAEHFVCIGSGRGVGVPLVEVSATPEELGMFRHVDRARGDTLLALSWVTRPPPEW